MLCTFWLLRWYDRKFKPSKEESERMWSHAHTRLARRVCSAIMEIWWVA